MDGQYNLRSPAVKRLMKEAREMKDATELFHAQPLEDNLFEWHFTIRGPADTEFDGGIYHGRIILPPEYPMKPPSIILLTPNGRFETNKKICLSISGFHPESWQPSWSIRTALLAIIGFMPSHGGGAIGSLDFTADERKQLAKKSTEWSCANCGNIRQILLPITSASSADIKQAKELASQINFQGEKPKSESSSSSEFASGTNSPAVTGSTSQSTGTGTPSSAQSSAPLPPPYSAVHQPANMTPTGLVGAARAGQLPPQWPPNTAFPFPMQWPAGWPNPYAANATPTATSSGGNGAVTTVPPSGVQTLTQNLPSSVQHQTSSSSPPTTTTSATVNEGLRQRAAPVVTETRHPADIVHRPPRQSDRVLSVLMVIVGIVLALLIFRRISMLAAFHLDDDEEF